MTVHVTETSPDLSERFSEVRRVFASGRTKRIEWRLEQLDGIARLVTERENEIAAALAQDLGRSAVEAWLGDFTSTKGEVDFAIKRLRRWMRPKRQRIPLNQMPGSAWVQYEPLGLILVIGPWNYPVYLTLSPLVAAIAAGNCAVVKPSELAPATSSLLARLIPEYLDPEAILVVEGDGQTTQDLLALGFDHALFTGGTEIGRKIMAAAAPTLTPVTLELGGKSPVIVAADADLDIVARRIAWVKMLNSGQTCIAPDYVLVDASVRDTLVGKIVDTLAAFQGDEPDGLRIVNERQFDRLAGYIAATEGVIATGGGTDRQALTIERTVIVDPNPDEPAMRDEIFGPILPVMSFDEIEEAVTFVNNRPKPLGLYVFTASRSLGRQLIDSIPAGGAVINHVALHCLVPSLPFGGVGASGMGAYHGEWGFQALSHRKAVLAKTLKPDFQVIYPPYTDRAKRILRRLF
ncbi:aldehyde dehydrogenase family protein [Rhodococcus sp. (in: high G+C Gram-positive bacteria)]|uniref:aldehyde dehydrogenase family protein n=1 Tax=Rhodococcus sp. TaxID=1831 RepID=UPI00257B167E|nr:aldehyde dehydrogenase family protein [Rhodococcus sp. (in: high G+C Gram-positive bacteria)]MBQ9051244.1 aldehyde dehydrogenase family protein [Rhodococcus sp. (in: high G+C Gram-positive bacteria)]